MLITLFNHLVSNIYQHRGQSLAAACVVLAGCTGQDTGYGHNYDNEFYDDNAFYNENDEIYTNAIYSTFDNVIVIYEGRGGFVEPIIAQYNKWAEEGKTIIIDGQVISADAFGAFSQELAGQTCYTDNAVFSPHAATIGNHIDTQGTEILATNLVDPLEQEFRASAYFDDNIGYAEITAQRLHQIYPQGACPSNLLAYTRLTPNF